MLDRCFGRDSGICIYRMYSYFNMRLFVCLAVFYGCSLTPWSYPDNSFNLHRSRRVVFTFPAASFPRSSSSWFLAFLSAVTPTSSSEISPSCLQIAISSGLQDSILLDSSLHLLLTLRDEGFGKRQTSPRWWLWLMNRFRFSPLLTSLNLTAF